jgi:hypothetical protein
MMMSKEEGSEPGEGVVPPQVIEHNMTLRLFCIGFVILCLLLHWICDF